MSKSSKSLNLLRLPALLSPPAPYLMLFTGGLLLLLYGYEIFNFSLSIDEEVFGDKNHWARMVTGHGRWGAALLTRIFPAIGNIPMISTLLFCVGLGVSGYLLGRLLFRKSSAQFAFVGLFVSFPIWPHIAEFSISAWCAGVGCVALTLSLLLLLAENRLGHILAVCLLSLSLGISETFYVWFLVLLCIYHLSLVLGTHSSPPEGRKGFPWLRGAVIAVSALLIYFAVQRLSFVFVPRQLNYVQSWVRLADFTTSPLYAALRTLGRCWKLLSGSDRIFLGYGRVVMLVPLVGLLILIVRLVWRGPLKSSQRWRAGGALVAAFVFALSPFLVSAGHVPARALIAVIPLIGFLAGFALSSSGRFEKLLYVALGIALFLSVWINVSLFYTDHLARQRDQVMATRIMARIDQIAPPQPTGRTPFVIVGARPWKDESNFHKVEIFGDSYFDTAHEGGNPIRIAAYLRTLGVNTLEPRLLANAVQHRAVIAAMPIWPAAGSVAMVEGMLVIKLGPLPPA